MHLGLPCSLLLAVLLGACGDQVFTVGDGRSREELLENSVLDQLVLDLEGSWYGSFPTRPLATPVKLKVKAAQRARAGDFEFVCIDPDNCVFSQAYGAFIALFGLFGSPAEGDGAAAAELPSGEFQLLEAVDKDAGLLAKVVFLIMVPRAGPALSTHVWLSPRHDELHFIIGPENQKLVFTRDPSD